MKKLFSYLGPYKKECILAPAFKMLEAVFELFVPLVVAALIDEGIGTGNSSLVLRYGLILFALAVVGMGVSITAQFFASKAAAGFGASLRDAVFQKVLHASFTELDQMGKSTLITRQTADINSAQNTVNMVLRLLLRSPFIVGGAWIMAAVVDREASLVFAVVIPVLSLITLLVMRFTIPRYKRNQKALDRLLSLTGEQISGARVIRSFGREEAECDEFDHENTRLNRLQRRTAALSALTNPLTYALVNAGTVAILYFGGIRVNIGALSQGQVVALVNYMAQILIELMKLANLIVLLSRGISGAKRVAEVLELGDKEEAGPGEKAPAAQKDDTAVGFRDVSLLYDGAGEEALKGISFSAGAGEIIGIIGPTASGKSSLVSLIPRFYEASKGQVLIDGVAAENWDQKTLRKQIGFVFQKPAILTGTVRENLSMGEERSDEELWEALSLAQAEEFVRDKEEGLDYPILMGGRNLSGGQRQRLAIARAFARKPGILILDDAFSALDYATEAALRRNLMKLSWKPVIFLVSQRTTSLTGCDRILVLEDGALTAEGRHEELLSLSEAYREIHRICAGLQERGESHA